MVGPEDRGGLAGFSDGVNVTPQLFTPRIQSTESTPLLPPLSAEKHQGWPGAAPEWVGWQRVCAPVHVQLCATP